MVTGLQYNLEHVSGPCDTQLRIVYIAVCVLGWVHVLSIMETIVGVLQIQIESTDSQIQFLTEIMYTLYIWGLNDMKCMSWSGDHEFEPKVVL